MLGNEWDSKGRNRIDLAVDAGVTEWKWPVFGTDGLLDLRSAILPEQRMLHSLSKRPFSCSVIEFLQMQ